ncbi:MAG: zinc-binding alcohol dehydrogenase [Verrucomicrobiae bacterium]|nr:zinc-binding alcohol dehydrogenase [Verrucomicrobiae bacterium]
MPHRLVFTGKSQAGMETFEPPAVASGQARVRALCSLMSIGTETIVFNRLFDPGTHWDRWVKYPFYPGYSLIGEVEEIGPQTEGLNKGDRVALRCSHASHHVVAADQCLPVPRDLDPKQAAWFALAKIASMGVRASECRLGSRVMVIGAGPVGQMAVRWLRAAGAEVLLAVDPVAKRLEWAMRGGATHGIAQPITEAMDEIKKANHGELPEIVIDSTGNAAVFAAALRLVKNRGRLVLLGDTGMPSHQCLTSDVISRGLSIVGAHDCHETAEWNAARIQRLFMALVQTGRFSLEGLNTHEFHPRDCVKAYAEASDRRGGIMGLLFDWTK